MSNVGVLTNNPGNLLVGSGDYDGVTGVYQSSNGLSYLQFATPQAGQNALVQFLSDNIGTNDSNSITNLGELGSYYLNGSYGSLTNTPNNPDAGNWLSTVENAVGIGPNQQITSAQIPAIATGIEHAEGTYSAFGPVGSASTANTSGVTSVGNAGGTYVCPPINLPFGLSLPIPSWLCGASAAASDTVAGVTGQTTSGVTPAQGQAGLATAIGSQVSTALNGAVSGFLQSPIWGQFAIGALGVILILGALFWLASSGNQAEGRINPVPA